MDDFFFTQIWNKRDDFTLQKLKLEQKFIQNELENLFFLSTSTTMTNRSHTVQV